MPVVAMPGLSFQSLVVVVVAQPAHRAASVSVVPGLCVAVFGYDAPLLAESLLVVVGQPAIEATWFRDTDTFRPSGVRPVELAPSEVRPPSPSPFTGVGQPDSNEVEALTDVRRTDARSAQISSPEGIARAFQVSAYSVEPREAVRARNLLSKDDWRAALSDETEPLGPEVALVVNAFASAGDREGLTGARAGPDGPVVGPAGESEGVAPDSDACEEVRLSSLCNIDM
jgi:hypothetical protein